MLTCFASRFAVLKEREALLVVIPLVAGYKRL